MNKALVTTQTKEEKRKKKLWKRLIVKFHPDLVIDVEEKIQREEIVKKLNQAYREHDIDVLRAFETDLENDLLENKSIEKLEMILVDLENMILRVDKDFQKLKESEWFVWRMKIKKTKLKTNV